MPRLSLRGQIGVLREALLATQWGFNHARCPACAGWDGKSENDKTHAKDCIVKLALELSE